MALGKMNSAVLFGVASLEPVLQRIAKLYV